MSFDQTQTTDLAITANGLKKVFDVYAKPIDRLKRIFFGSWRFYHREFEALKGVSFTVRKGESVGIIGRNGAGKSTLLQILTGTLSATAGTVSVNGRVAAVLELGSGFNPELSGRDNVLMYASLFGLTRNQIDDRYDDILRFAGLEKFIDQPIKTYSSGMQARLAFSVIAHVDADILIIDEALSVGDAAFTQKCMTFLREFQKNGTILFVSHDMGAVAGFCDQAIWIEEGVIALQGASKEVCEQYYAFMQTEMIGMRGEKSEDAKLPVPVSPLVRRRGSLSSKIVVSQADQSLDVGMQKIESFGFNLQSVAHGSGDARILGVEILSAQGHTLGMCEGGMPVKIRMDIEAVKDVPMPIVGFIIKDRLGQPLVGGNTFHSYKAKPVAALAGQYWEVEFDFRLPILAVGDYSIVAAIGNGTLDDHIHLHWMHDAVHFKVVHSSILGVIVGMPLDRISLTAYAAESNPN
jgi:lipopolysaccharide transport system ATP-binding protein